MIKLGKIDNYYFSKDGKSVHVAGQKETNTFSNVVGREHYDIWLRTVLIQMNSTYINKDLYCEFDQNGRAVKAEVK